MLIILATMNRGEKLGKVEALYNLSSVGPFNWETNQPSGSLRVGEPKNLS